MSEPVGKIEDQVQRDRKQAFERLLGWLEEVHGHMSTWKDADPNSVHRNALYFLVKTISDSCKGSYVLTDLELYDQAGALLRVAIENLWLLELFGSAHSRAKETLTNWINGKRLQPASVRKMLAEEFDEINVEDTAYLQFMNDVYSELCNYIHPQPMSMSASAFERNLVVVLISILETLPNFFCEFHIEIPDKLFQQGDFLAIRIAKMLTNHLPQEELRKIVEDFSSSMAALTIERTGECGDTL